MASTAEIIKKFKSDSKSKAANLQHRKTINFNINKYTNAVAKGKLQFKNLDKARAYSKNEKWRAIEHLDNTLELFEKNFSRNGGKVLWAQNAGEALQYILDICNEHEAKFIVKSKSMVTEELHLNKFLEKNGIESIETDLGEYIQQLDDEPPYHIVTPAMHKSKEDVADLFHRKLNVAPNQSPEQLTLIAREKLREKFATAKVGITGANFIISDTGSIALTENEGNARLSTAFPKVHIAVVGIEKVIPKLTDLNVFWPLLATFGTGQKVTVYNSIISGPKQVNESDGPHEMYVILLDNGRTNVLQNPVQRQSLYCIRCGACLNVCPVYKTIGGHAYAVTYSGPIGSVLTPNLENLPAYKHLSYASSLCGACTDTCAVKIELHELLLNNRSSSVQQGYTTPVERGVWKVWRKVNLSRKVMNMGNAGVKNLLVNKFYKGWTQNRGSLNFTPKTFNQMWREQES